MRTYGTLRAHLLAVERLAATPENLARDPVRFPKRYTDPHDVEVAAVVAAMLAYGRVDLFGPVIARVLAIADAHGGPGALARNFDDPRVFDGLLYRWNRAEDFVLLFRTLQAVYARHPNLGALFVPGPAAQSLGGAIDTLRALAPGTTRGFRTWLPHPEDGSACKRWLMLMRWMVRTGPTDLGLWTHLSPADLVIPVDTHVKRIATFIGLTTRADAGWKTAEQITAALAAIEPADPVRFDFALAHLGISGACLGKRDAEVCPSCPLTQICTAE